jgi:hypothetical protein
MWKVILSYSSCIVSNLEHANRVGDFGLTLGIKGRFTIFQTIFFPLLNIVPLALNMLCRVSLGSKTSFGQVSLQSHTP